MSNSAKLHDENQVNIQSDLRSLFAGAVKLVLESVLEEEVKELCGAERYERAGGRQGRRNGQYLRSVLTSVGHIEVSVPRTREHGAAVNSIGRYKRRMSDVDEMIEAAYIRGVSVRDMSDVTRSLMGEEVSASTVSRITRVLDEKVETLRNAPIEVAIPYLYVDATFIKTRWARTVESTAALVAYGVDIVSGKRQLLAVTIGASESEESWSELFTQLEDRGLHGVQLVIADDHKGLAKAVRRHIPEAERQRCTVHFMRNILAHSPKRLRKRLGAELSKIFQAKTSEDVKKLKDTFVGTWHKQLPELVKCLGDGFAAATKYLAFPTQHWTKLRSTNGVERLNVEIKRRTKKVGAFPDRKSALRLITAVLMHATAKWDDRQYFDMSLLQGNRRNEENTKIKESH